MKKIIPALLLLIVHTGKAQSTSPAPSFYVMDSEWKATTLKKAVYMVVEIKESDTSWRYDRYHIMGPLIETDRYRDQGRSLAHGKFLSYNQQGTLDSMRSYFNGLAHGRWYYLNDTGTIYLLKEYDQGRLIRTVDYLNEDTIANQKREASLAAKRKEKDSEFPGGISGWRKFLNKNFRYPQRAFENKVQGTVILLLTINKEGFLEEPDIFKSVEYSLDQETVRIMKSSPKWTAAEQDGIPIRSFKKQPITYMLR